MGFVLAETSWEVIHDDFDDTVEVGFVAHYPQALVEQLAHHPVEWVVVESRHEFLSSQLVDHCDRQGVGIAALITTPGGEAVADEHGVSQRVRQPSDLLNLAHHPPAMGDTSGGVQGVLAVVWGAQGSPGRTTMAVTLASALAHAGHSVMLIDADPRGGTVASMLGLLDDVPGFLAACRLAGKGELDEAQMRRLRSVYTHQATEFHVLTGVARMTRRVEVPRDSVDAVLERARQMYAIVIVDPGSDLVPRDLSPGHTATDQAQITSHLVGRAEHLITVIDASPVGIARFARAQIDLDALVDGGCHRYWLNRVDLSRKALKDERLLAEALWRYTGVDRFRSIPLDEHNLRAAMMAAKTLSDRGGKQPILAALRPEIAQIEQFARAREARQVRHHLAAPVAQPGRQGMMEKGVGLWRRLTALR